MRLKIKNIDRPGLVFDISKILLAQRLNIISMEVKKDIIYLETETVDPFRQQMVIDDISRTADIMKIENIQLMPHEEEVQNLKIILNTIREGILAIDLCGRIKLYNPSAEQILHISSDAVMGRHIEKVLPCCSSLVATLRSGKHTIDKEIFFEKNNCHYLVSTFPINDKEGQLAGGVAVLKSMKDIQQMYRRLTEQASLGFENIFYRSAIMQNTVSEAQRYANGDSTILIRGETGTGKELFARAIHTSSPRKAAIFIAVNCASIPETLLESELFGYADGSFTGGRKGGKPGLFELANNGTLFLDEIGELSTVLQPKLLRVLQERKVRRIGSKYEFDLNVRILAATHQNLEKMVELGQFRQDLYYRLNVLPLYLPPLRERKEDIPFLAKIFLDKYSLRINHDEYTLTSEAAAKLQQYAWPGNIRELENILERAVNLADTHKIYPRQIIFDSSDSCFTDRFKYSGSVHKPEPLKNIFQQIEKYALENGLKSYSSSRELARVLGISHTSVIRKMQTYGLSFSKSMKID